MTVHGANGAPSLYEAARELGVRTADLDRDFGVVPIDPANNLYCVEVRADRIGAQPRHPYRGPFSNPRIDIL
jgi:hypothetical protein